MAELIDAVYEQGTFKPLEPVELPEGQRVTLSVEPRESLNKRLPLTTVLADRSPELAVSADRIHSLTARLPADC